MVSEDPVSQKGALQDLADRVALLEARVRDLALEINTARLVVAHPDRRDLPRLVADTDSGGLELRIDLPASMPGRTTGVVLFALRGQADLAGGVGLQIWADGNVVEDLTWWTDQERGE